MNLQNELGSQASKRSYLKVKPPWQRNMFFIIKRLFDIFVSFLSLLLLLPLFLTICYILYKKEGKPVFHQETMVGKRKRIFMLYTFRTLSNRSKVIRSFPPHPFPESWEGGVPNEFIYKDDLMTIKTRTGMWLKKYKLYKIPQLINVIKGDLSIIGPEPEKEDIAAYYNYEQAKRLEIKPGIISYTRKSKDVSNSYNEKIKDDLHYIRECSYRLEMKILIGALTNQFHYYLNQRRSDKYVL